MTYDHNYLLVSKPHPLPPPKESSATLGSKYITASLVRLPVLALITVYLWPAGVNFLPIVPTNTACQLLTLNLYSSVYRHYLSVTHIEPVLQCVQTLLVSYSHWTCTPVCTDTTCQLLTLNLYSNVYRHYLSVTHIEPVLQCVQTSEQQHGREIGLCKEGAWGCLVKGLFSQFDWERRVGRQRER